MTKILIKRGQAEANLPTLDPGEPAVTFDSGGKLWIGTPSGNLEITGGGGGSPGAPNGSVQFNDGGSLGGSADFLWSDSDNQLLVGGPTPVSANSVLEAHDSYVNTVFILANDTASAELNTAAMGFYLKNSAEAQTPFAGFEVGSADLTDGSEDGYFTIATMFGGTSTPLFRLDPTAINLNYLGRDTDTIIQGDTATKLGVFDAGLDAFQVGTTVAGAIADFRSTAIVLNNAESDVDIRWGGNGLTNAYFYDSGLDRHGFGTGSPGAAVYIDNTETSGTPEIGLTVDNTYSPSSDPGAVFPTTLSVLSDYDSATTPSGGFALAQFLRVRNVANGVMSARCLDIIFQNLGNGTTGFFTGVNVRTPTNSGGGAITTAYGLKVEAQNIAGTNYAIYTDAGRVRFGDGVTIDTTTAALTVPRMTTTQQNALTGVNGMIIFNSSTGKFRGYAGGAWVDLH